MGTRSTLLLCGLFLVLTLGLTATAANLSYQSTDTKISPLLNQTPEEAQETSRNGLLDVFNPGNGNTQTSSNPLRFLKRLIKRCIVFIIKLLRSIFHRFEGLVNNTANLLDLVHTTNYFGPFIGSLSRNVASFLRALVNNHYECVGRVLCELSDSAGEYLPMGLKQAMLIYFSANQESNLYYQPLANGFVSQRSCARLYMQCDQQKFLYELENANVTVPEFRLQKDSELNEIDQTLTSFGRAIQSAPVVEQLLASVQAAAAAAATTTSAKENTEVGKVPKI